MVVVLQGEIDNKGAGSASSHRSFPPMQYNAKREWGGGVRLQPNPTWAVPRKFNTCGEKKKKKKGEGREKGKRESKG